MVRRWIGLSVVALSLGGTPAAWAQSMPGQPAPSWPYVQGAAPTVAEPMPYPVATEGAPGAMPAGIPGGMPGAMPGGCPVDTTAGGKAVQIPADAPTAWNPGKEPGGRCGCYFDIGGIALQHEGPGHLPIAIFDSSRIDNGNPIPRHAPLAQDLHSIGLDFAGGPRATLGYHWDSGDVEVSGFYLPRNTAHVENRLPGQLDALFYNPPLGFEGDNGLWLQADIVRSSLRTELASGEATINWWNNCYGNFELGGGVRYIDEVERLNIFTDDDGLTVRDVNGNPDPRRQANYLVRTHNRIVGPQINGQLTGNLCPWLNITMNAKACVGANFLDSKLKLERGDGFVGFSNERERTIISQVYETGLYLDWCFCDGLHLRTGYAAMWLVDVAVSQDQVDYNLKNTLGRVKDNGSIFYQGPVVEFQLFF